MNKPTYQETTLSYMFQRIEGSTTMRSPCTYRDLDACRDIAKELMGKREFQILRLEETYKEFIQE